jgi:hypothetical protein
MVMTFSWVGKKQIPVVCREKDAPVMCRWGFHTIDGARRNASMEIAVIANSALDSDPSIPCLA